MDLPGVLTWLLELYSRQQGTFYSSSLRVHAWPMSHFFQTMAIEFCSDQWWQSNFICGRLDETCGYGTEIRYLLIGYSCGGRNVFWWVFILSSGTWNCLEGLIWVGCHWIYNKSLNFKLISWLVLIWMYCLFSADLLPRLKDLMNVTEMQQWVCPQCSTWQWFEGWGERN